MQWLGTLPRVGASLVALVILSCAAARDLAGQAEAPRKGSPTQLPDENTPREIVYPYYSLREGTESTLYLMDFARRPIEFTIAVHGISGNTVWAKPKTIHPQEDLEIDFRRLLRDLSADVQGDFSEGSVSLHFKGTGNPLGGRMIIQDPEGIWNLGPVWREGESGQGMIPARLDSLWWELGGSRDAELKVVNTSGKAVVADLFLDVQGTRHAAPPLRFGPYGMRQISITEVLAQMRMTAFSAPAGGVRIVVRDSSPVLIAHGKLVDPERSKSVRMVFPLPQLELASALHATAVPISVPRVDSPFAGTGNYTPHVIVRNLLDSPQTLTLTVEYPGETSPQQKVLSPILLPGFTTRDISLDNYYYELPLPLPFCALRVQYNGPPGSVIAQVVAANEDTGEMEHVVVANEGNGYAGSLVSYWAIDDQTDFYVFLTNMGDKRCRMGFCVEAGGVEYYLTDLALGPRETKVISMRELRDRQRPDFRGNMIPAHASEGRLRYTRMDNVPVMGSVLTLPRRSSQAE